MSDIEERELWRAVIDSSEAGRDILEPAGAARAARRARRALFEYGIPLRAVAEHASASEESRAFLEWNRQFEERCRQLDCISADELLGQLTPPGGALDLDREPGMAADGAPMAAAPRPDAGAARALPSTAFRR